MEDNIGKVSLFFCSSIFKVYHFYITFCFSFFLLYKEMLYFYSLRYIAWQILVLFLV